MAYSDDDLEMLRGASDTLRGGSKEFFELAESTKDKEKRFLYKRLGGICSFMSSLYVGELNHAKNLNVLFDAVNELPQRPEFDKIKDMVEIEKNNVRDILIPIKEAIEKSKHNGADIYG